jgi:hypothetical protein
VRARSLHLFPEPTLRSPMTANEDGDGHVYSPFSSHSISWLDGVSVAQEARKALSEASVSILTRGESDNPWSDVSVTINCHVIAPNRDFIAPAIDDDAFHSTVDSTNAMSAANAPYTLRPTASRHAHTIRGQLRCTNLRIGPCGTGVWIRPRNRAVMGLATDPSINLPSLNAQDECVCAAVFTGPFLSEDLKIESSQHLSRSGGRGDAGDLLPPAEGAVDEMVEHQVLFSNPENDWSCMDYDEATGRVVLGSTRGTVTILQL